MKFYFAVGTKWFLSISSVHLCSISCSFLQGFAARERFSGEETADTHAVLVNDSLQGLLLLLQNLPTHSWTSNDISILTAEAYQLKVMFANAPKHLSS